MMQQVASSAPCALPWTILAAIADVESGFGKTADQSSSAPVGERRNSTNFHYALPAMARYLCAEDARPDLRAALFAYNHADWYVAEIVQLAVRYGGIGASGGGLIERLGRSAAAESVRPS